MVSLGKLYTYPNNHRAYKALIAAKYNNVTLDIVPNFQMGVTNKTPDFLKKFPLGKVPAFETADGHFICESNAIALYVAAYKPDSSLLGKNALEMAEGTQFINMLECYLVPAASNWLGPIAGYLPFDAKTTEKAQQDVKQFLTTLDKYLITRTFLVSQRITIADIIAFCALFNLYTMVMDPTFRAPFVNVNRWFITMMHQPEVQSVTGTVTLCEKMAVFDASKVAKPTVAAAAATKKPAKKADDDEEEEDDDSKTYADKPKPKSPLDLLPPSKFSLDDWKRFYSNNPTRPDAVNYLWEKFDKEGFSIWRCEYKYNEELTKLFMTGNLVGGFFQRLDEARKYAFGSMLIFGTENNSKVSGYFIFRGQDIPEMVRECPDFDSYSFTKVNTDDEQIRKDINQYLAWDAPNFAEGRTFK